MSFEGDVHVPEFRIFVHTSSPTLYRYGTLIYISGTYAFDEDIFAIVSFIQHQHNRSRHVVDFKVMYMNVLNISICITPAARL